MTDYEKLLDEAYSKVKKIETAERFEIPKVDSMIEGTKTLVFNFPQICSLISRDCQHVSKFLSKELATQIIVEKERTIFNRKLSATQINEKIEEYVNEFVICPQCKKPDTELIKDREFIFLHCLACGAKRPVRAKI